MHAADLEFTVVEQIAARLGDATRLLVVGGPALNFWGEIMHPVLVLESRAHNVAASPKYRTPHGISQLEASVYCAREYLREMIASKPRAVLKWNERLYHFRTKNRVAHYVAQHYGIDVFDSVVTGPELSPVFISKRYPQMLERVNALRTSEAARKRRSKDTATT